MKKIMMAGVAIILIIIALSSLGHIVGMAISLVLVYFSLRQFLKSTSVVSKLIWAMIGICGLIAVMASLPALAGVIAIYLLYMVLKNWKKEEKMNGENSINNPFDHFDQQWEEINKNYR